MATAICLGLADPQAVAIALNALNAVQLVGMPEADCIIAQCAVYLARAPKSTETYLAMKRCQRDINEFKGPQPSVPLHLRNATTKLMQDLGKCCPLTNFKRPTTHTHTHNHNFIDVLQVVAGDTIPYTKTSLA